MEREGGLDGAGGKEGDGEMQDGVRLLKMGASRRGALKLENGHRTKRWGDEGVYVRGVMEKCLDIEHGRLTKRRLET